MTEEWRPIAGYAGFYEISSHGNVRSLARIVPQKNGAIRKTKTRLLRPTVGPVGYGIVGLTRGDGQKSLYVHRLVAEHFHNDGYRAGLEVRHLDGNKLNNHVENLRWGTSSENNRDIVAHGRHASAIKENCPRGHALAAPNLVSNKLVRGVRECLACKKARSYLDYRGEGADRMQQVGDMMYGRIAA